VVELDILRRCRGRADKRDAVVVGVAAQEHHAAGHHFFRVHIGDLKPEHLDIKPGRAFDILHVQHDMPDLADAERQPVRPLQLPYPVGIVAAHRRSPRLLRVGQGLFCGKALPALAILQ